MKQGIFTVLENTALTDSVYRLRLAGDTSAVTNCGQFVNLKIDGTFLRRPLSVCDVSDGVLTLIYKTVGKGTELMSLWKSGDSADILTGLGNGFRLDCAGDAPLLIGGGLGLTALYTAAKELTASGRHVNVILGFGSASECFYENEFRALGAKVTVTTADGSYGKKGLVTDAMDECDYSYFFACGPEEMLRAVCRKSRTSGQLSFESRMGCGFGACMGCSCRTITGSKRICRDGPVLEKEEILWGD